MGGPRLPVFTSLGVCVPVCMVHGAWRVSAARQSSDEAHTLYPHVPLLDSNYGGQG